MNENNIRFGVVLLSAGTGSRMNSDIPKQYIVIEGHPLLYYSLYEFEMCPYVSEIVIVAAEQYHGMIMKDIVTAGGFSKVSAVTEGGKERYNSVYNGLKKLKDVDYVMIHDGARPCINSELLHRLITGVMTDEAVVPAVPSKDTIRLADDNGYVISTPRRDSVWNVQTPQTFKMAPLMEAFNKYMSSKDNVQVTDDAMIWEMYNERPVRIIMGDYSNIKLTTSEDLEPVKLFLKKTKKCLTWHNM